ncbi:unnamed protein product [Brachionus calyciflorus]|uniref:Uncharacterized protein n=1 Tax=Brachionus calyciflorus TaxID=104777 RepID=A0A813YIF8_9BILA|nr:unnamed protein product [Brachionus calyciflorus]
MRNIFLRESSLEEHTHSNLEFFEIEIEKALGALKSRVFNSILEVPQIYEEVRADLARVVSPVIIASKFPPYRTIKSQLYYIRSKSRPALPTSKKDLTLSDEFIVTNDSKRF